MMLAQRTAPGLRITSGIVCVRWTKGTVLRCQLPTILQQGGHGREWSTQPRSHDPASTDDRGGGRVGAAGCCHRGRFLTGADHRRRRLLRVAAVEERTRRGHVFTAYRGFLKLSGSTSTFEDESMTRQAD
ncbi:hypothetical protein MRX96_054515 [Rhipicephalus microplus]